MKIFTLLAIFNFVYAMDYQAEGQKALKPLKQNLMKTLKGAMKAHGPIGAVGACNIDAPKIATNASSKTYTVGRSSMKYRNEGNKPKSWMVPVLEGYEKSKSKKGQVVRLKSGNHAYVEPIYVQGVCLSCHGPKLMPKLDEKVSKLYPQDKALGYKLNDFRGIFWVEFNK
jgi:hypothetical protein